MAAGKCYRKDGAYELDIVSRGHACRCRRGVHRVGIVVDMGTCRSEKGERMSKYRDIPRQSPPPKRNPRAETISLIVLLWCTGVWLWLATQIQIGR